MSEEDVNKALFLHEQLKKADEKFVDGLIERQELETDLKEPLIRLLGIRRSLRHYLDKINEEPAKKEADVTRLLEEQIIAAGGKLGEERMSEEFLRLNYKFLKFDAESVEGDLVSIAFVSSQIARREIDYRLTEDQGTIGLLEMRKILGNAEIRARQLMKIAKERVPLFPIQTLAQLEGKE